MHLFFLRTRAVALVLIAALVVASPQRAAAEVQQDNNLFNKMLVTLIDPFRWIEIIFQQIFNNHHSASRPSEAPDTAAATPSFGGAATFYMFNNEATMELNEPNPGGLMTRTVWGGSTVKQAGRVVIHTFGSENSDTGGQLNTVLAAYRGSSLASLVLLKFNGHDVVNDNYVVPGISTVQSLIQFDVAANTPYRVQIGSRNGAEGDIYANVFVFPPGGGLSAFLATYDGFPFEGRDYTCELGYAGTNQCWAAKFVVHNSTNQPLTVTPTTTLGGAFVFPAAFTLAPGQAKTAEFVYDTAFNQATPRTIAGHFKFTGRNGSTAVSVANVRGWSLSNRRPATDRTCCAPAYRVRWARNSPTTASPSTSSSPTRGRRRRWAAMREANPTRVFRRFGRNTTPE
jgi:hypothetical protein